ncbi:MAG TPA: substrate-binding domain-containing protein [Acidobacteriaceae bacterium]|nr:substrate-binding domain-containing protein [Acidobacteriaceae bacterium]
MTCFASVVCKACLWLCVIVFSTSCAAQSPVVVRVWGSPQMSNLLQVWENDFCGSHPEVRFVNELKSTVTAAAGVYTDRADIGALGREIWPSEVEAFRSIKGHPPLLIAAAGGSFDVPKATFALMLFVHRDNPTTELTMEQVRQAFSEAKDRSSARTWGELGAKGAWASRPIHLYGFATQNDKSMIFRDLVFKREDLWAGEVQQFEAVKGVDAGQRILDTLANDPYGLAISNVHYARPEVRPLRLVVHGKRIQATRQTVATHEYPLSREVFLIADPATLTPAGREFLNYVASPEGQRDVLKAGDYLPLPEAILQRERARLAHQR